ncbi:barwin-like endoglucanase, partial [Meredithblackwellia eburnea MCA 4105]
YYGQATWYTQDGNAGSCGQYHGDYDLIVAMNSAQVNGGSHCGKTVHITNTSNGKSLTAVVADECPGCGYGSLDLSLGAFEKIGDLNTGVLPITWYFA